MKNFLFLIILCLSLSCSNKINNYRDKYDYVNQKLDFKHSFYSKYFRKNVQDNPLNVANALFYYENTPINDSHNTQKLSVIAKFVSTNRLSKNRKAILKDTIIQIKLNDTTLNNVKNYYYNTEIDRTQFKVLAYYLPYHNQYLQYIYFTKINNINKNLSYEEFSSEPKYDFENLQMDFMKKLQLKKYDSNFIFGEITSTFYSSPIKQIQYLDKIYPENSTNIPLLKPIYMECAEQKIDLYSFIGQYNKMFELKNEYSSKPKTDKKSINFTITDAASFIDEYSSNYDIFMLNEDHQEPISRWFANTLLSILYKNGYRYLAVEALQNEEGIDYSGRTYIKEDDGFYLRESTFSLFLQNALNMGFKLISYESIEDCTLPVDQTPEYCMQIRDNNQAKNIMKVYEKDANAKIFVYAGFGHIRNKPSDKGLKFLGVLLSDSKKKIFSLNQTQLMQESNNKNKSDFVNNLYSTLDIKSSSILMKDNKPYTSSEIKFVGYDAFVIHPKRELEVLQNKNITPWYYNYSIESPNPIKISISNKVIHSYLSIIPLKNKEDELQQEIAPIFKYYIENKADLKVYLPKYNYYLIKFEDENGTELKRVVYDSTH